MSKPSHNDELAAFVALAERQELGHPFHHPGIVTAMADTYRCNVRYGVVDGRTGFPAFGIDSMLGGRRLSSGPFQFHPQSIGDVGDALRAFFARAQREDFPTAEFKLVSAVPASIVDELGLAVRTTSIMGELNLADDPEHLLQAMQPGLRSDLRRWARKFSSTGFRIGPATGSDFDSWYRLLVRLYRDKHHTIAQPKGLFQRLLALGPATVELRAMWDATGELVAGIVLLKGTNHWEYAWSAARSAPLRAPDGTQLGAIPLLIWSAIQDACAAGVRTFGFGSSQPNNTNLREFKRHWGCTETPVQTLIWNPSAAVSLEGRVGWTESIYARLPMPLVERLPQWLVPLVV